MTINASRTDVGVAIVTYNSSTHIEACIKSLQDHPKISQIAVWDNASTDHTVALLESMRESDARISIIVSRKNVGFGRGINSATGTLRTDYVLILNPDAELVEPTALNSMLERFRDESVGMVGPLLVHEGGQLDPAGARRLPTILASFCHSLPLTRKWADYNLPPDHPDVEAISGACMLMPCTLYARLRGFDTDFFMYGEDLDLCLRVAKMGKRVVVATGAPVLHHKGGSSGKYRSWRINHAFFDAQRLYYIKHLAVNHPLLLRKGVEAAIICLGLVKGALNVMQRALRNGT